MMNVQNQRPGDLWIVGSERYEVVDFPIKTTFGFSIKVIDNFKTPHIIYIDVSLDEV